jgi:hypothetical protein
MMSPLAAQDGKIRVLVGGREPRVDTVSDRSIRHPVSSYFSIEFSNSVTAGVSMFASGREVHQPELVPADSRGSDRTVT